MQTRTCRQCGEIKPLSQYRKYYGGRKGNYTTCLDCERINSRVKYLTNKAERRSAEETEELDKIHRLWDLQRSLGLRPPRITAGRDNPVPIDDTIAKYAAMLEAKPAGVPTNIPADLEKWLTCELTDSPEYYQDVVYEQLKKKYLPMLFIDKDTMLPVHDETYRVVLSRILERFDDYEDRYYA